MARAEDEGLFVQVTTLDTVLGGRTAAVVKVDVEGGEAKVLAGARNALLEGRIGHLIYEAHDAERHLLASLLSGQGYTVFGLGRHTFRLSLSFNGEAPCLPKYEPPSYLATRTPDEALARLLPSGWRVLSREAVR